LSEPAAKPWPISTTIPAFSSSFARRYRSKYFHCAGCLLALRSDLIEEIESLKPDFSGIFNRFKINN